MGTAPSALPQALPAPCPARSAARRAHRQTCAAIPEPFRGRAHRTCDADGALEQVGPADVAHEDEVARRRTAIGRIRAAAAIGHEEPRCSGVWPGVWTARISIWPPGNSHRRAAAGPMWPVGDGHAYCIGSPSAERYAHRPAVGELPRARQEVGMDVRFGHRRDAQALGRRDRQIAVDVTLGIDDERLACLLTPNEIGVLGQSVVVESAGRTCSLSVTGAVGTRMGWTPPDLKVRPTEVLGARRALKSGLRALGRAGLQPRRIAGRRSIHDVREHLVASVLLDHRAEDARAGLLAARSRSVSTDLRWTR